MPRCCAHRQWYSWPPYYTTAAVAVAAPAEAAHIVNQGEWTAIVHKYRTLNGYIILMHTFSFVYESNSGNRRRIFFIIHSLAAHTSRLIYSQLFLPLLLLLVDLTLSLTACKNCGVSNRPNQTVHWNQSTLQIVVDSWNPPQPIGLFSCLVWFLLEFFNSSPMT